MFVKISRIFFPHGELMCFQSVPFFFFLKQYIVYSANHNVSTRHVHTVPRAQTQTESQFISKIKITQRRGTLMDWFHCNQCFTRSASKYAVSSCGHICCEKCITSKQCVVCRSMCSFLPITDEPQEKVFFKDPVKLIQSRQEHISQIAHFQRTHMERAAVHFKHKAAELDIRLKEVTEHCYRQLTDLKRENAILKKQLFELQRETAELKKPLSQRRVSPGQFQTDGNQRMSLPVAVTSPVTPRLRTMSQISSESQGWARERGVGITTPGSATSISSHSSLQDHRTPASFSTPIRTLSQTPQVFQFQFLSGLSVQSPRN
ncbi:RING finger protein 212B-like isoform X2 [Boleophthalmus pectinirostris]|uniref:RING finger protein 212B-like isoform X2 n=1 Tax=Boleophthalmus pectinirostris TaxID=150288 RepID=UPI00242ACB17|nr:RING finger protein 212B-like isoform X2 [Boleophthalmus pectinirostris]